MNGMPPIEPQMLAGQVALVTGGGRGIGRAIAQELSAAGAKVAVTARSTNEIDDTVKLITDAGGEAIAITCDIVDPAAVEVLVADVEAALGSVTLLVNNAATLAAIGPMWETSPELWRVDIDVTLFGTFNCARAALRRMVPRRSGRIVNVSSMNAVWGLLYTSSYDCAKTAQLRLTEGLAGELKPHGIKVFALAPGPVRTRMSEASADPSVEKWMSNRGFQFDIERDPLPADRPGRVVVHLASGYADALSGRYVTVQDDLGELVGAAEKIQEADLLTLRLETLDGRIETGRRTGARRVVGSGA